jgi:hypothetical protein
MDPMPSYMLEYLVGSAIVSKQSMKPREKLDPVMGRSTVRICEKISDLEYLEGKVSSCIQGFAVYVSPV